MTLLGTILRELRHHGVQSLLTVVGLTAVVALLTAVRLSTAAAERETRRVMRDLGFNLRIVARETDAERFWSQGFSDLTLPESTVATLAAQHGVFVTFNHLTPTLERRFRIRDHEARMTGLGPSIVGPGEKKQPMGFVIPEGHVFIGAPLARALNAERGGKLTLSNRTFTVDRVLSEVGTVDDIRIYLALPDAQYLLSLPGQISEIQAVDCLCLTSEHDPLGQIRKALSEVLPGATVFQVRHLAEARARQRQMAERAAEFAIPLSLAAAALWTGVFMMLNVRERRAEIGLWRALGRGSGSIAALFLGRSLVLGLAGAVLGWGAGTWIALEWGPGIFPVTAGTLKADVRLLGWSLILTPTLAAIGAFLPAMLAVAQDPVETLRAD